MASQQGPETAGPAPTASTTAAAVSSDQRRGQNDTNAARSETNGSPLSDRDKLRISLLRNARYHEDRERFFARIHKLAMFIVVIGGSSLFADYAQVWIAAALITLAGTLDLVFDVSGRARLHASLRRRIYDVLAQAEDPTRDVSKLQEQAVQIYADEPPCMHVVNNLAWNGALASFGRPPGQQIKITGPQRFFRHWFSYSSVEFKTYDEIEQQQRQTASRGA